MEVLNKKEFELNDNVLTLGNFNLFVAYKDRSFKLEQLMIYDGIIIDGGDLYFTLQLIRKVRGHSNPEFYLKPLFLLNGSDNRDPLINMNIDGVLFSFDQSPQLVPTLNKIYLKIADLTYTKSLSYEAQVIDKTLNLLYTREKKEINPVPYYHSGIGYTFPELSVNYDFKEEWQVFEILQIAEEEGLFSSEYIERVYLCNSCSCSYLVYREVCPQCDSTNSVSEDLVHHFPCAYIGPVSDFKNELDNHMHCPKCYKSLRHIGVDYDKPSIIYTCKNCDSKFQDFNVKSKCLGCSNDSDVQYLVPKEVRRYSITRKGESAAVTGFISTSKDIEDFIGTVKIDTFKVFLKYEIERLKQSPYVSNIACIHLRNAGELFSMIGTNSQRSLLKELVEIVRRNLRSADIISFESATTLLICMNDIPEKVASHILEEISTLIRRLLQKNFKNFDADIRYKVVPIDVHLSHDVQLQYLTREFMLNV